MGAENGTDYHIHQYYHVNCLFTLLFHSIMSSYLTSLTNLICLYTGGVIANFLLTFLLAAGTAATSGIGHPSFYSGLTVTTTSTTFSPAEKGKR